MPTTNFKALLFILMIAISGCATKVYLTKKYIRTNEKFHNGLTMSKLVVDSFDIDGKPVKYTTDSIFRADDHWSLDHDETLALLKGDAKTRFAYLLRLRDSLGKKEFEKELPQDTLYTSSGIIMYLPAGKRPPDEFHLALHELDVIKYRSIDRKLRKIIYFTKPNKHYMWTAWNERSHTNATRLRTITFLPGSWYKIRMDCSFGLMSSGWCTFYFSFDDKRRITVHRQDERNLGPF